jgi:hypothetical protein
MKRECNCCCKLIKQPVKCFINKSCDWISCPSCITKQIKMKDDYDILYCCPNCRKDSVFNKHSKITKYCKSNRSVMNHIIKLQRLMLIKQQERLNEIHQIITEPLHFSGTLVTLTDIGGNEISDEIIHISEISSLTDVDQQILQQE